MKVKIQTEKEVEIMRCFVLRGVKESNGVKRVLAEQRYDIYPPPEGIAKFISETGCDFASIVENYYLEDDSDLPFF